MEVLGGEFGGLTPQELAAPVNTVAVSLRTVGQMCSAPRAQNCVICWWTKTTIGLHLNNNES